MRVVDVSCSDGAPPPARARLPPGGARGDGSGGCRLVARGRLLGPAHVRPGARPLPGDVVPGQPVPRHAKHRARRRGDGDRPSSCAAGQWSARGAHRRAPAGACVTRATTPPFRLCSSSRPPTRWKCAAPRRSAGGRQLGLTVAALAGSGTDLDAAVADTAAWLAYFSARYGRLPADDYLAVLWGEPRGMEYDGATTTSAPALEHEVFHTWFGRGRQARLRLRRLDRRGHGQLGHCVAPGGGRGASRPSRSVWTRSPACCARPIPGAVVRHGRRTRPGAGCSRAWPTWPGGRPSSGRPWPPGTALTGVVRGAREDLARHLGEWCGQDLGPGGTVMSTGRTGAAP